MLCSPEIAQKDTFGSSAGCTFAFSDLRTCRLIQQLFPRCPGTPALSLCRARISQNRGCIWVFCRPRLANCSVYVASVVGPSSWCGNCPQRDTGAAIEYPFNRTNLERSDKSRCQLPGFGTPCVNISTCETPASQHLATPKSCLCQPQNFTHGHPSA
jgi:hypothetical protein